MSEDGIVIMGEGDIVTADESQNQSFDWLWYLGLFYAFQLALRFFIKIGVDLRRYVWAQVKARLTDRKLPQTYGKWAVVTGSTDGIGKAYARELAKAGHDIILISRTMEKLKRVAEEIKKDFGVQTEIIQADFSHGRSIYEGIGKQLDGKDIGILVNNVGALTSEPVVFGDVSEDDVWRMININVTSVPAMTKLVLPGMLAKHRGAIINIASMAANFPVPRMQVYSGTKAFVDFFTRALQFEYRSSGVTIQAILPGGVMTNMTKFDDNLQTESVFVPKAETFAAHALATLGHTNHSCGYWGHSTQMTILGMFHHWIPMFFMEKNFENLPKKTK